MKYLLWMNQTEKNRGYRGFLDSLRSFSAPFYFYDYTSFFAYILLINPTMLIKIMAATLVAILNWSLSLKTLTTQTTKKITNKMFLKLFAIVLIVNILSLLSLFYYI